jgi:hypothetical protein
MGPQSQSILCPQAAEEELQDKTDDRNMSQSVELQEDDLRVLWKLATRSKQLSLQECSESQSR